MAHRAGDRRVVAQELPVLEGQVHRPGHVLAQQAAALDAAALSGVRAAPMLATWSTCTWSTRVAKCCRNRLMEVRPRLVQPS